MKIETETETENEYKKQSPDAFTPQLFYPEEVLVQR